MTLTAACDTEAAKTRRQAEILNDSILNALQTGDYNLAIELIDTLNAKYPNEIDLRKSTLLSRAKAMEGLIRDSIPLVDAKIAEVRLEMESLKQYFSAVAEKGLPGYIVDKGVRNTDMTQPGKVQPRLGDALSPWVIEVSVPKNIINIDAIAINTPQGETKAQIVDAASRMVKGTNANIISVTASEADILGTALNSENVAEKGLTLAIFSGNGSKPSYTITLTKQTATAIERTYRFAQLREEERKALLRRELLERMLITAQNQVANNS